MSIFWINSILIIVMIFMESQVTSVSLIKWEAVFDPTFGCIWMDALFRAQPLEPDTVQTREVKLDAGARGYLACFQFYAPSWLGYSPM